MMNSEFNLFKIKTNDIAPEKGRILISEPFFRGTYFKRAIILLAEYSEEGSVGFILNKPVHIPVSNFQQQFPGFEGQLFVGGPVNTEYLYFIHTLGETIPGSMHITDNLYWSGSFDTLSDMIRQKRVKPDEIRFFLGYSGWGAGQLEQEIKEDSWLVSKIQIQEVMRYDENYWIKAVKELGGKYRLWENFPSNPTLN